MGSVDFDAARAERQEAPHTITVDGRTYHLRQKLPPAVIEYLAPPEGFDPQHPELVEFVPRFSEVARVLLLDDDVDPLEFAARFDEDEWQELLSLYGFTMGESSASPPSSSENGEQSRPILPNTSELTSAESSTGN